MQYVHVVAQLMRDLWNIPVMQGVTGLLVAMLIIWRAGKVCDW